MLLATMLGLTLLLTGTPARAQDAAAVLERFVASVHSFEADFEQVQRDEFGDILQQSRGRFWLQRPGRFRWEVQAPYQQLLVSDGEVLWLHDPDLDQATRRPAGQALSGTPAALLAEGRALEAGYTLRRIDDEGPGVLIELTPREGGGDFEAIRLRLVDDVPVALHFEDQLGGSTDIQFRAPRVNQPIAAALLRFEPPPGTEVVAVE